MRFFFYFVCEEVICFLAKGRVVQENSNCFMNEAGYWDMTINLNFRYDINTEDRDYLRLLLWIRFSSIRTVVSRSCWTIFSTNTLSILFPSRLFLLRNTFSPMQYVLVEAFLLNHFNILCCSLVTLFLINSMFSMWYHHTRRMYGVYWFEIYDRMDSKYYYIC